MSSIVTFSEFFDYIVFIIAHELRLFSQRKRQEDLTSVEPFSVSIFPPLRKFDCLTQEVISNFPDESCLF